MKHCMQDFAEPKTIKDETCDILQQVSYETRNETRQEYDTRNSSRWWMRNLWKSEGITRQKCSS